MEKNYTADEYREVLRLILRNARYNPGDEESTVIMDVKVLDRVREAMADESPLGPSVQSKIIMELGRVIGEMGGDSNIMSIVGSYRDTLPDAEILDMLTGHHPDMAFLLQRVTKLAKGE